VTRVVLLGASNLALGFPLVVRQLLAGLPRPLEIFGAFGHGRSYCTWSRVLFRGLPGIDRCGLWNDLERIRNEKTSQTLALVTDLGNDLIYGSQPELVARRVEQCLGMLSAHGAEIVVTRLPLTSVERLSALRYHATRTVFFPRTRGSWPEMRRRARALDTAVEELGSRFSVRLIEQPLSWYGFDPIHIRRSRRAEAWRTIFSGWSLFAPPAHNKRLPLSDVVRLHLAAPAERRLFGRHRMRLQPALQMDDVPVRLY